MSTSDGVRKRPLPAVEPGVAYSRLTTTVGTSQTTSVNDFPYGIVGQEITTSRDNPDFRNVRRLKRLYAPGGKLDNRKMPENIRLIIRNTDTGNGSFESIKKYVECSPRWVHPRFKNTTYDYQYDGPWFAVDNLVDEKSSRFPAVPTDLRDRMIALGATAIARTIPTNPVAGAAQFLGELREGVPRFPSSSNIARQGGAGVAGTYVGTEFGWKPLLSDLQKFGEAVKTSHEVLNQLHRDSGRLVRRRYSFPEERVVEDPVVVSTRASGVPPLRSGSTGAYLNTFGTLTRTRTTVTRYWFSGAYTYYVDMGDSAHARLKRREQDLVKLFGLRITPELFWELTPWSWLADWSSNMGDIIHNFSALSSDSLVMRYGYMMCHMTITDTYLLDGVVLRDGSGGPLSQSFTTEVKKRVKATPYGFGLDPAGFTTRQLAILAALGKSRAGRKL